MPGLIVAAFLIAHGLVHLFFLIPQPPATASGPDWPFELDRSRLLGSIGVGGQALRGLGLGLIAIVLVGYAAAALAASGIAPAGPFMPGVLAGSLASLALLVLFFQPWLVLGLGIDLVLLWATVVATWRPEGLVG